MGKLTMLHINIIGAVVALIVAGALYYFLIQPANKQIEENQVAYNGVKERADKLPAARRNKEKAEKDKADATAQYAQFEAQYMPILGYTNDRLSTMRTVFWPNSGRSWPERFIRTYRAHMAQEQKARGIVWENPGVLRLGPYGPDPNTIQAGMFPGEGLGENGTIHYRFPMTVRARSIRALMDHIRAWQGVRGMGVPTIENFQLAGNSPNLIAQYDVTLTIIVRDAIPPVEPRIGGQQGGSGGFGGGFPGFPGGMPGPGGFSGAPGGRGAPGGGGAMGSMGGASRLAEE